MEFELFYVDLQLFQILADCEDPNTLIWIHKYSLEHSLLVGALLLYSVAAVGVVAAIPIADVYVVLVEVVAPAVVAATAFGSEVGGGSVLA